MTAVLTLGAGSVAAWAADPAPTPPDPVDEVTALVPGLATGLPPGCEQTGPTAVTCTYNGDFGQRTPFVVPDGVTSVGVTADGGQGGAGNFRDLPGAAGGLGARISGSITVVPGQQLDVVAGQAGRTDITGSAGVAGAGFGNGGGGGNATRTGGGGGGGSAVLDGTDPLLVAAGGGGGGGGVSDGGAGGASGSPGADGNAAGGPAGDADGRGGPDGGPGEGPPGFGNGGGGGGGGGGVVGGAGGGVGTGGADTGGGGGGGASLLPDGTVLEDGAADGDGSVVLTYTTPGPGEPCPTPDGHNGDKSDKDDEGDRDEHHDDEDRGDKHDRGDEHDRDEPATPRAPECH